VTEGHRALAPNGSHVMDINFLLKREQIALMLAKAADTLEARDAHECLARFYGARVRKIAFSKT
jgi:hypothetical protein